MLRNDYFKKEEHLERFNIIKKESRIIEDVERLCLFYVISGNKELWTSRHNIYNTLKNEININKIRKLQISSSAKAMLLASLNLYNGYKCNNFIDTFANLDKDNFNIMLNAIRIRFNQ